MSRCVVGVIGAGVIGRGVAHCCASFGIPVVLVDLSPDVLNRALTSISRDAKRMSIVGRRVQTGKVAAVLDLIETSESFAGLTTCDVIVENITEDFHQKAKVYLEIEEHSRPEALIAANTSALPITQIGSLLTDPSRLVGMHFMNPVPLTSGVELIRGVHSSDKAVQKAKCFLEGIGKRWILVKDSAGFIANRVLMLSVNEAAFLIQEGVASAQDVDRVFVECFGHPMGVLETADLIGLDTVLRSIEVLYSHFCDAKYRPCPLLKQMVHAGFLGQKSGRGFYEHWER